MRIIVLIMFYTMIYIKINSAQRVDVTRNNKNHDVSVKPISSLDTLMSDSTHELEVTFLNINYMDNQSSNLSKSIKINFIHIKFQVIDYDLLNINEFVVDNVLYATDDLYVNQNGKCLYLQIYIPGYIFIDIELRTVSYSISVKRDVEKSYRLKYNLNQDNLMKKDNNNEDYNNIPIYFRLGRNLKSVIMPRNIKRQLGNVRVYKMHRNEDSKRKNKFSERSYFRKKRKVESRLDDEHSLLSRNLKNKKQYYTTIQTVDSYNIRNVKSSNLRKLLERELKMEKEEKRRKEIKRMYNNSKSKKEVIENSTPDYDYFIDESLKNDDKDYEDYEIDTYHDYDYDYSKLYLTSTLANEMTEETTDYDYFIDDSLESDDKDEDDYEEPEVITYVYDYFEENLTTFSTVSTTIDVEQLQTEITFTLTSEEIDVAPFVTLAPTIETTTLTTTFVITETSTIETTITTTESTTEITQVIIPAVTTEFMILTTTSPTSTSTITTEATSMTTEYTSIPISTTEITTTEKLSVEEKTSWIENLTELLLPEKTKLMTTDEVMKTSVTTQPTMTLETSQIIPIITENVTVTELIEETTKTETEISEIITTITFTSIEFVTPSYTTEETSGSVHLESTTSAIKEVEQTETFTTEITYSTFIFTPDIIINVTTEESSTETLPTSTELTYSLTESFLETSTITTESEIYISSTTSATFLTYYIDKTIPEILETTVPLSLTMSTEMITLSEGILEPTSVTTQSTSLIFTESTSSYSEIIESSTYNFTIFSFETFTTKPYVFPTTSTFIDQIVETTISLPSTILPEIITLMEDIFEPTSTTTFSTLTEFSTLSESTFFPLLLEIDTSPISIYSITTYTKLEEETSTIFQEITLTDFETITTTLEEETFGLTTSLIDTFLSETYTPTPTPYITITTSSKISTTEDIVLFLSRNTTIDVFTTIEPLKTSKTMSAEKMKTVTNGLEYEEFYDEEYGKDYKEAYEGDEYEDENKSLTNWYDYEEEEETKKVFDLKTTPKFRTTDITEEKITSEIIESETFSTVSSTTKFISTEIYSTLSEISTIEEYETSTTVSTITEDFEKTLTTKLSTPSIPTVEEYTLTSEYVITYTTEHLEWWADQSSLKKHDHTLSEFEIDSETKVDVTLPKFIYSPDETTTINMSLITGLETITQTDLFRTITDSSVQFEMKLTTDKYFQEKTESIFSESETKDYQIYITTPSDFTQLVTTDDLLDDKITKDTGKREMLKNLMKDLKMLEKRIEDLKKMEEEQDKREKEWKEKKGRKDLTSTYPDTTYTLTELEYSSTEFTTESFLTNDELERKIKDLKLMRERKQLELEELENRLKKKKEKFDKEKETFKNDVEIEFGDVTETKITTLFKTSERKTTVRSFEKDEDEDEDEDEDITDSEVSHMTLLTKSCLFKTTFKPPIESEKFTPAPPTERTTSILRSLNRVTIIPEKCNKKKKKRKKVKKGDYSRI